MAKPGQFHSECNYVAYQAVLEYDFLCFQDPNVKLIKELRAEIDRLRELVKERVST